MYISNVYHYDSFHIKDSIVDFISYNKLNNKEKIIFHTKKREQPIILLKRLQILCKLKIIKTFGSRRVSFHFVFSFFETFSNFSIIIFIFIFLYFDDFSREFINV